MLQERNEIKISDTSCISIGDYMDNNDGIMYYWPENKDGWISFFSMQDPIIILWTLSYLESEDFDFDVTWNKLHNFLAKDDTVVSFLKKYCWKSELRSMFVDFVFGEYSEYGDKELPEIVVQNEVIEPENFDLGNHVFVKNTYHSDFNKDLEEICDMIITNLRKE